MAQPTPEWIPVTALALSVLSIGIALYVARWNFRLTRAQRRTDLLTKIVDLRLQYNRFNRRISDLKTHPPSNVSEELKRLLDNDAHFRNFEFQTEGYRRSILQSGFDAAALEDLRHPIEALLKQLEVDNERLDQLLQSNPVAQSDALRPALDAPTHSAPGHER
jgi:hypothetical protein